MSTGTCSNSWASGMRGSIAKNTSKSGALCGIAVHNLNLSQSVTTWQRHWFGRFKRKSIIISKSKEMVDLTMALLAKFWVNGNQDELLSLLG